MSLTKKALQEGLKEVSYEANQTNERIVKIENDIGRIATDIYKKINAMKADLLEIKELAIHLINKDKGRENLLKIYDKSAEELRHEWMNNIKRPDFPPDRVESGVDAKDIPDSQGNLYKLSDEVIKQMEEMSRQASLPLDNLNEKDWSIGFNIISDKEYENFTFVNRQINRNETRKKKGVS